MTNLKTFIRARLLPGLIIAIIAMTAGVWSAKWLTRHNADTDPLNATRFPQARLLQPFNLVDHNGNAFDNTNLQQHWSFLFFGYTHCPDVCPTTLSVLNSVAQRLQGISDNIRFVMVTVDPDRDTPEKLREFVTWFNGDFVGVTGAPEKLEQLTRQLGIMHMRVEGGTDATDYLVDHTAGIILIDPDSSYHAVFTPPLDANNIEDDFKKIFRAYH